MTITYINNLTEFHSAINTTANKLVVVDFYADWCGPCKMIAPLYESLSNQYAARAIFLKVDVDAASDVARYCSVSAMPTFHFYRRGVRVADFSGANPDRLRAEIEKHAPSSTEISFADSGLRLGSDPTPSNPPHSDAAPSAAAPSDDIQRRRMAAAAAAARRLEAKKAQEAQEAEAEAATAAAAEAAKAAAAEAAKAAAAEAVKAAAAAPSTENRPSTDAAPSAPDAPPAASPPAASSSDPQNDPRLNVNVLLLSQMVDEMGFPRVRAEKALILTGNKSVAQALDWCFEHADDPDIDEPLQVVTKEGAPKPKLTPEEAKKRAEELNARARAKREAQEKKEAIEREKQRLKTGKETTIAKQKLEEESRKRAVEEKRREKREALLERQRVRAMLEADKKRRRELFHMPPSDQPSASSPPVPRPPAPTHTEPSAAAGKIQFRMPDGSRIEGEFDGEQTMNDVVTFLLSSRPELSSRVLTFSQQYPRKVYLQSEYGMSLSELNLLPRAALTVSFS
ncbi:Thioredoxin [Gracilariopsis chorda]|uniref:Thioredoxin n=1 Tax=Gracilariopsis chorda TaxID=448386 RepID=A0A2V3J8F0_9FLOR|nr:Thioredoxin [Gracilariopsis chorda]|eukprot:PXF50152.1 Thioredoxin [Gracilariopsis chorda]